jgi:hypothetical protein
MPEKAVRTTMMGSATKNGRWRPKCGEARKA